MPALRGSNLIFITHDGEVMSVVDEAWEIRDGKIEPEPCEQEACGTG